ncbi:MAG: hypothetical protein NTV32_08150 [Gammaproteobacteria bacterium]|nr:hypothetical protein [Gammaproteobacteria bacterium]
MPKFMSMEDYQALKKKYQAEAETQNNPQAGEFLSGQAQHLKAAPNAVDYKNFNGQNIEETTLVKTAFNQNLTTNITENYAPGVTSAITEVAPSIHHETNLTDSYSASYQSATENINVQKEVQNIDVTNWQAIHKNLNLTVPGTLKQQILKSGNITVDQYQAQIQHQTIKAETYTHNFDTATFDGPVNIQSSGQIHFAGDIHIGPDASALDSYSKSIIEHFPKISGQILAKEVNLPPYATANFIVKAVLDLEGTVNAEGTDPVPLTVDKNGLSVDLQNTVGDYFGGTSITGVSGLSNLANQAPNIVMGYKHGNVEFSNGVQIASNHFFTEFIYTAEVEIEQAQSKDWVFSTKSTASLHVKVFPIGAGKPNIISSLMNNAAQNLETVGGWFKEAAQSSPQMSPEEITGIAVLPIALIMVVCIVVMA